MLIYCKRGSNSRLDAEWKLLQIDDILEIKFAKILLMD